MNISTSSSNRAEDPIDFVQKYIRELENQISFFNQIPEDLLKNIRSFEYKKYTNSKKSCIEYAVRYHKKYRNALKSVKQNAKTHSLGISNNEHNSSKTNKTKSASNSNISSNCGFERINSELIDFISPDLCLETEAGECSSQNKNNSNILSSLSEGNCSTPMSSCKSNKSVMQTSDLDASRQSSFSISENCDKSAVKTKHFDFKKLKCSESIGLNEGEKNDHAAVRTGHFDSKNIKSREYSSASIDEHFNSKISSLSLNENANIELSQNKCNLNRFSDFDADSFINNDFSCNNLQNSDNNFERTLTKQNDTVITINSTFDSSASFSSNDNTNENSQKHQDDFLREEIDPSFFEEDFDLIAESFSSESNFCEKGNVPCSSKMITTLNNRESLLSQIGHENSAEFRKQYPHTDILYEILHTKFGLQAFRPLQEEIINACLAQHDCFVLMPTGGGKSLCYQLPAIMTPGVTIVVSPLRSLISDQVAKLNALDIPTAHLCPDLDKKCNETYVISCLQTKEPTLKLLYVTPEKISGGSTLNIFQSLYKREKLARFVIDEAHCISQWGHDFRPDYKKLAILRDNCPGVPIMCLTATATKIVQNDVTNILNLRNVKTFVRSFNRPNIKYEVLPKTPKSVVQDIANIIYRKFRNSSGIIYCTSRASCETVAQQLCSIGIKAAPYHAGMASTVREKNQLEWMQDKVKVIVATIAFGMGIDKPDVRFVIHHSIPKSVEAYYQESGRAGRDGEISYSYLFYHYSDVIKLQRLLNSDVKNQTALEGHLDNLHQVAVFCENKIDCRRYLQLIHLGEKFDRKECIRNAQTTCDNCLNRNNYERVDFTQQAIDLAKLVKDLTMKDSKVTMMDILDSYKGIKSKKTTIKGYITHPLFAKGAGMDKSDIYRILKEMVYKKIILDKCVFYGEFPIPYVKVGPNFSALSQNEKIQLAIQKKPLVRDNVTPNSKQQDIKGNASKIPSNILLRMKRKCHEELLDVCQKLALEQSVTLSSVMNLSAIKCLAEVLPKNKEEFLKIEYVTQAIFNKYGETFLEITLKYNKEIEKLEKEYEKKTVTIPQKMFGGFDSDFIQVPAVKRKRPVKTKKYKPRKKPKNTSTKTKTSKTKTKK